MRYHTYPLHPIMIKVIQRKMDVCRTDVYMSKHHCMSCNLWPHSFFIRLKIWRLYVRNACMSAKMVRQTPDLHLSSTVLSYPKKKVKVSNRRPTILFYLSLYHHLTRKHTRYQINRLHPTMIPSTQTHYNNKKIYFDEPRWTPSWIKISTFNEDRYIHAIL